FFKIRYAVAHLLRQRGGLHRLRVGVHVDELGGDERRVTLVAVDLEGEGHARAAELRYAAADGEQIVVARRAEILDRRFAQRRVVRVTLDVAFGIGQADRAPVFGDRGIDVGEVVAVEHDLLHVHFGPAHTQLRRADVVLSRHDKV